MENAGLNLAKLCSSEAKYDNKILIGIEKGNTPKSL